MPLFIDESGDTGHAASSTSYFRLAAVMFPSEEEAESFRSHFQSCFANPLASIIPRNYEIKYSKTQSRPDERMEFFESALSHQFQYVAFSINKKGKLAWRNAPSEFLHYACCVEMASSLFKFIKLKSEDPFPSVRPHRIIVDDNRDGKFLKIIEKAFCVHLENSVSGKPYFQKPRFRNSKTDLALQLADMVCGAFGEKLDGGNPQWHGMIKSRCIEEASD